MFRHRQMDRDDLSRQLCKMEMQKARYGLALLAGYTIEYSRAEDW